ncbi:(2Fe-2S) ferredoxin domain-containing protein [Paenibacillus elgii]|uniref:(2Fe-2S) ferredoxin domain-containing protein n=1 Tax=Paenibacillus elgii TaxID=189691 RepID=UPI0013D34067|nr:(2Fe-2S) ferredoxin domain-containing protein [Paenibacillus elgii]
MTTWNLSGTRHHVLICNGGSCMRQQGEEVTKAIREEIALQQADVVVHTTRTRCNGRCEDACIVIVYPEGVWYKEMTPELGRELVKEHLLGGRPMREQVLYTYQEGFAGTTRGSEGTPKPQPSGDR